MKKLILILAFALSLSAQISTIPGAGLGDAVVGSSQLDAVGSFPYVDSLG